MKFQQAPEGIVLDEGQRQVNWWIGQSVGEIKAEELRRGMLYTLRALNGDTPVVVEINIMQAYSSITIRVGRQFVSYQDFNHLDMSIFRS